MTTQEIQLRSDCEVEFGLIKDRVPTGVYADWWLARTIPKDHLKEVIEGMIRKPKVSGGVVVESNRSWSEIDGYNKALSDLLSALGLSNKN